jgi:hypothetical protein
MFPNGTKWINFKLLREIINRRSQRRLRVFGYDLQYLLIDIDKIEEAIKNSRLVECKPIFDVVGSVGPSPI